MSGFRDSGFGVSGYSFWGALGGQARRDLGGGRFGLQGFRAWVSKRVPLKGTIRASIRAILGA